MLPEASALLRELVGAGLCVRVSIGNGGKLELLFYRATAGVWLPRVVKAMRKLARKLDCPMGEIEQIATVVALATGGPADE